MEIECIKQKQNFYSSKELELSRPLEGHSKILTAFCSVVCQDDPALLQKCWIPGSGTRSGLRKNCQCPKKKIESASESLDSYCSNHFKITRKPGYLKANFTEMRVTWYFCIVLYVFSFGTISVKVTTYEF